MIPKNSFLAPLWPSGKFCCSGCLWPNMIMNSSNVGSFIRAEGETLNKLIARFINLMFANLLLVPDPS